MNAISALNARLRSNPWLDYFCSTHFWGPASNFGIPIAAIADARKDPVLISGSMTAALIVYSATFMRYSMAIQPANKLLFGCHFINELSQLNQGYRFLNYWKWGGREKSLEASANSAASDISSKATDLKDAASAQASKVADKIKSSGGTN